MGEQVTGGSDLEQTSIQGKNKFLELENWTKYEQYKSEITHIFTNQESEDWMMQVEPT